MDPMGYKSVISKFHSMEKPQVETILVTQNARAVYKFTNFFLLQ